MCVHTSHTLGALYWHLIVLQYLKSKQLICNSIKYKASNFKERLQVERKLYYANLIGSFK